MVVNPVTIAPERDAGRRAAADGRATRSPASRWSSRATRKLVGILTNRDVRFATNPHQPVRELMTKERADHGARGRVARRGQAPAAPAPHREAAGGRRRLSLHRPDHRQGHREGAALPQRHQGREGPPARRRRDRHRRQGGARAPRRCSTPRSTSSSSTPRTAIPRACSRRSSACAGCPTTPRSSPATSRPPRARRR